jgi:asparagine synthase (glutamine-hydrolysing)
MCGIAGLYELSGGPVEAGRLEAMCSLMRHRGPDDGGVWARGRIGLGHRRLSVVDLSRQGRNPMPNEDQRIWLTFNGEIYNHRDLRPALVEQGHVFRSETDTEVILHLYERDGEACLDQLNGMFAFALWSEREQRLLLARDRFGVKPVYYAVLGRTLAFASEVKAFLALPEFRARADRLALAEHLTFQNTLGDRTFFEGVHLLPPGHSLSCRDGQITIRRHWELSFESEPGGTPERWAEGLRERFEAAVTRQLMSDVPLGSYLSGGLDTGSISAVAARRIPSMHTFACGFDLPEGASELEQYFDERPEARCLARQLGTIHHELELGPDAMVAALPRVVWHLDEPRAGISYQVYHTAAMIRRYVTVVLSGVGGDELFAGYPWRYQPVLDAGPAEFEAGYYRLWVRLLTDGEKRHLFTDEMNRALGDFSTFEGFRAVTGGSTGFDPLHRALHFDFKTFLHGLLLVDDKLSMAHSVEARVPFLDNELVDYVTRIPADLKLRAGRGKRVLRAAMRGLLPEETLNRRKQGFTPPDETWYRGASLAYVRELILGSRARERGYFRPRQLETILEDHVLGRRNHRFLLWSLMCFEWWNRLFVDGDAVPEPVVSGVERP